MDRKSNGSERRPVITTLAPPSANSNAIARLKPAPPPVAKTFILCSGPPNWPRLCDLSACCRALTARLSTLPHRFAFVFPALRRAGFAYLGTDTAHPVSESRAARKQGYAGSTQFKTFVTKPDTVPHHDRILVQGLSAALSAPA